jgi:hypothetical protein
MCLECHWTRRRHGLGGGCNGSLERLEAMVGGGDGCSGGSSVGGELGM